MASPLSSLRDTINIGANLFKAFFPSGGGGGGEKINDPNRPFATAFQSIGTRSPSAKKKSTTSLLQASKSKPSIVGAVPALKSEQAKFGNIFLVATKTATTDIKPNILQGTRIG